MNSSTPEPLFKRALGEDWQRLPTPLRNIHDLQTTIHATGSARIERGSGLVAQAIANLFGFPKAAPSVPVEVIFERLGESEKWTRKFGSAQFATILQTAGPPGSHCVLERFGGFAFKLRLELNEGRLSFTPERWSLLGVPLPVVLAPFGNSYEHAIGSEFHFHIEVCVPGVGLVVSYIGTLSELHPHSCEERLQQ
ncbi:MAG: DUF4166 domain-containing protein [Alphaproteobacteria bacterium]|nr:DUF4166 domain-containing protein [Alphaproteobacteria bacterium]